VDQLGDLIAAADNMRRFISGDALAAAARDL
jgi:hypothetical protein